MKKLINSVNGRTIALEVNLTTEALTLSRPRDFNVLKDSTAAIHQAQQGVWPHQKQMSVYSSLVNFSWSVSILINEMLGWLL